MFSTTTVVDGVSDVPREKMIPTPNQSSLQVGLSLSKKRVSKKAIKSSFLFRTEMELRVCNSGSKLGKESSYSVKNFGAIPFEEEEEG
ncbi:hypothetical protein OIU84_023150 [Salix udensis]|uniref:Uncharacterized protein n=1 Tax=Salix udensis TaxID=889485 RepID=A0AAD6KQL0_9ROSI|nr:hypothetical protein OIU84_023150 [Salix udensis]